MADVHRTQIVQEVGNWKGRQYLYGGSGNGDEHKIDCSHLVYQVFRTVFPSDNFTYLDTAHIATSPSFTAVTEPLPGDLIWWPGHVGIVVDSELGKFVGAQTSTGVAEASYSNGYWSKHKPTERRFYRYTGFHDAN